jgi:hypothetical protein
MLASALIPQNAFSSLFFHIVYRCRSLSAWSNARIVNYRSQRVWCHHRSQRVWSQSFQSRSSLAAAFASYPVAEKLQPLRYICARIAPEMQVSKHLALFVVTAIVNHAPLVLARLRPRVCSEIKQDLVGQ